MRRYDSTVFAAPPSELAELLAATNVESFFGTSEWFGLIAQFGLSAGRHTGLVTNDQGTLGFPFMEGGTAGELQTCTNLYSCEFDLLGDSSDSGAVADFVSEFGCGSGASSILFEGLDPGRPSFAPIQGGLRKAGFVTKPFRGWGRWFEETAGASYESYFSSRPSVLRNTWRRRRELLATSAPFAFSTHQDGGHVQPFLSAYVRVCRDSWKDAEPFPEFVDKLVEVAAACGALRAGILTIEDSPAAAQFWIVWRGRATIFKLAYAKRFGQFSPGTLLTMHMMKEVLENDRPIEIDFGRGDDDYKKLWLRSRREHWGIEAADPRTFRGFPTAVRIMATRALRRQRSPA